MGAFTPGTHNSGNGLSAQVEQDVPTPITPDEIRLEHPTNHAEVLTPAYSLEYTGLVGFQIAGDLSYDANSGTYAANTILHYDDGTRTRFDAFPLLLTDEITAAQLSNLVGPVRSEADKKDYVLAA